MTQTTWTTNFLAYVICKKFDGEAEIKGPEDNPLIEAALKFTKNEDHLQHPYTDEIPWCSAWVNLMVFYAMAFKNFRESREYFHARFPNPVRRAALNDMIKYIFNNRVASGAGPYVTTSSRVEKVTLPTGSALAYSWTSWGDKVPLAEAQRGDIVVTLRKGGHHVAFLDQDNIPEGATHIKLYGGNQSDKVCAATFLVSDILEVRRERRA